MSEVLSEPAGRGQRGLGFFPADERQTLRIGRFLMAAGTSLLVCVALSVCAFLGLLPWDVAIKGTAGVVALAIAFYAVFRSGLNLRFTDPSLTTEMAGAAILFLAYIMYHAPPARESLTLFYPVALLFGVLRLTAKRMMVLALLALVAHGTMLHLSYLRDAESMDADAALIELVVLMIVLPWFAVMGGYVNRLRLRLADSNRVLKGAFDRIEQLAQHDELTGVYNRRYLMDALVRERSRAERLGAPFSVCLLDIDHFKAINDTHGHAAGDAVLRHLPDVAAVGLRGFDVFGRLGGEEFLLVLPGTDLAGAMVVAERVRAAVDTAGFPGIPAGGRVSVTLGVAQGARGEEVSALLARADRALYLGKATGRNRVETDPAAKR
jgi:diguanylate cyclase (GGDEF)-like protein